MARRTLKASQPGIEKAKRALKRLGLVQKDLTIDPLIASWGTINNFFNGRAIDHTIFKEICFHLELNWQEIYEPPEDTEPEPPDPIPSTENPLLLAVQQQSAAAREALTPRILERIPREVVRKKYLPAIDRGVSGEQQRVIPIIAPAGYGKSTILGDLYDELIQRNTPWVGLILCSTLSTSANFRGYVSYSIVASTFAPIASNYDPGSSSLQTSLIENGFGKSLCGNAKPILEVVEQLNQTCGRGVLLIDTLDLVIGRDFITLFNQLLRQLLDCETTIVFTCRDHEYNDYLEPVQQRLAGIAQTVDRHSVPNFTTGEIRAAAEAFFRKLEPNAPERGQQFADNILALSADNRSLRDIIENPLLLALLCDLFAQDGNVPADLTVSKLYRRFWDEKVAYSRSDQSRFVPKAIEKEGLCLTIARVLFGMSQERLCESVYRDELGVQFTEVVTDAYNDLLSEGVIDHLPSGKLHFFHQTLLEYAIAYWLTRHNASSQRQQWLEVLQHPEATRNQSYWYPVLRQYLTLLDTEAEFATITSELGTSNLGVFSAIAFAAVSRDRSDALRDLLPVALDLGDAYQRRLQQALESAPKPLVLETWQLFLTFLQQGEHTIAINTAKTMSLLIARWWESLKERLPEAIEQVIQRSNDRHNGTDDRALILGWLLQHCLPLIRAEIDRTLTKTLRQHYQLLGHRTSISVIQLHQQRNVPITDQIELFNTLLFQEIPNYKDLSDAIVEFMATLLRHSEPTPTLPSALEFLYQKYSKRWDTAQSRAVGRRASVSPLTSHSCSHSRRSRISPTNP